MVAFVHKPLRFKAIAVFAGVFFAALAVLGALTFADDDETGRFQRFIEEQISTPDMQIRLGQIDGALSSDVRFSEITIADRSGVWLRIENPHLVWSRLALLRGRLDVDSLTADRVSMRRRPQMDKAEAPDIPENGEFALPDTPVAINIGELTLKRIELGEPVAGIAAALDLAGSFSLGDGSLASDLAIRRLDVPAEIALKLGYDKGRDYINADIRVHEDQNGLLSNLLGIEGRPALDFSARGEGPVADFSADITLDAAGQRLLAGKVALSRPDGGMRVVADLDGNLQPLIPDDYRDLFAGGSRLKVDATRASDGKTNADVNLQSGVLALDADVATATDGFPTRIVADAKLDTGEDRPVALAGDDVTVRRGSIALRLGEGSDNWTLSAQLDELESGTLQLGNLTVTGAGMARDLSDPQGRGITFDIRGQATGLATPDAAIAEAFGDSPALSAMGGWSAGRPVKIMASGVRGKAFEAGFKGSIASDSTDGTYQFSSGNLSAFSALAGRSLGGALGLAARGKIAFDGSDVAILVNGRARDLNPGAVPGLFKGETQLSGSVERTEDLIGFRDFTLTNKQLSLKANGSAGKAGSDLAFSGRLADASALDPRLGGAADLQGSVKGPGSAADISVVVLGEALTLAGKPFNEATATLHGRLENDAFAGDVNLRGRLAGELVSATAQLSQSAEGVRAVRDIVANVGSAGARGGVELDSDDIASGTLNVVAPDLRDVAALAMTEMSGRLDATVELSRADNDQRAQIALDAARLAFGDTRVGSAKGNVTLDRLNAVPEVAGNVAFADLRAGSIVVRSGTLKAQPENGATRFGLEADLVAGHLSANAVLAAVDGGYRVGLDKLSLTRGVADVKLVRPSTLTVAGDKISIDPLELHACAGRVVVSGTSGERIDVTANIRDLPLALANAFAPSLGLKGSATGAVVVSGPSGDPETRFDIKASGVSAAALAEAGVGPLGVSAKGVHRQNTVTLERASASGNGLELAASGTIPLTGGSLSVPVRGTVPLSLAKRWLDPRGAWLSGTLTLDVTVTGPLQRPDLNGSIRGQGVAFSDPATGIDLRNMDIRIGVAGRRLRLETVRARLGKGTATLSGSLEIDDALTLPADLRLDLQNAHYTDGDLAAATASGTLTLGGALLRGPVIGGRIILERTEIMVPKSLPGGAAMIDVRHADTPADVRRTLANAGLLGDKARGQRGIGASIDLVIEAPARLFIRGRGLDAEMRGSIRLRGSDTDLVPEGGFTMVRGRIDMLGKRVEFTSGEVTLAGDFDPYLQFVATTRRDGLTVTISVTGPASDPDIVFSSEPELPQDEVLAQLLFGRSVDELSAFQLARLADAAAQLSGRGGVSGVLDKIRKGTGLDDLDVVEDKNGKAAVKAGTYLSDNVYLGVQAGEESSVSINLDITKGLKLKGQAGQTDSGVGIFYESEY
ncbi:MAG: hypothetical protein C0606_03055 [Hyphomicrobiales bacterium]|nr:MAG: hypothetical protein C0606_03055 [Hyphomicrobiales bacterium]